MTEAQVLELFSEGNPVPDLTQLDDPALDSAAYLTTLEQRSSTMTKTDTRPIEGGRRDRERPLWLIAAIAAVIVALGAIAISQRGDDVVNQPFGTEYALDVANEFVVAHNEGNFDRLISLFAPGAEWSDDFSDPSPRPTWEPRMAWDLAAEEQLLNYSCSITNEVADDRIIVTCNYQAQDAVGVAADSVVDITASFTMTPNGIASLHENILQGPGLLDYVDIGEPFQLWLEANHPDVADEAGCCEGETVEESVTRGELRATYARLWGER